METLFDYRPMRPEDAEAMARLYRRATLLGAARTYGAEMARSWAFGMQPDCFVQDLDAGLDTEVAEAHGAIMGFCVTSDDEIKGLYVDPAFTGREIAAELMRRALERIHGPGHEAARMTAAHSAAGFYEAMGFRPGRGRMLKTRGGLSRRMLEMVRP